MEKVIWQYWETREHKPKFIDGLRRIVERNAGAPVQLVTPDNIAEFLPELPDYIHRIDVLAHKADMIRTMLLKTLSLLGGDLCHATPLMRLRS